MRVELNISDGNKDIKVSEKISSDNTKDFMNDFMDLCDKYKNVGNKSETKTEIKSLFPDGYFNN